jgi:hypothetical protein
MGFSFDWTGLPDPYDAPHLELMRLASERGVDIYSESFAPATRRLIHGEEPIPLNEPGRLRGLAKLLRCEPRYIVNLVVEHCRATGQPVPDMVETPPPVGRPRKSKRVNSSFGASPRWRRVSDDQVRRCAHMRVEGACAVLGISATGLRNRLRALGYDPKQQGRPCSSEKNQVSKAGV